MEWRYVYPREDIWKDRQCLLEALSARKSFRNPLIVSPQCITFLNAYREKCSEGIMTPVWPQDFKKAQTPNHNTSPNHNYNRENRENNDGEHRPRPSSGWRGVGERSSGGHSNVAATHSNSSDFQKFAVQAWQPQVLNQYSARIKDLRSIFNKWTPRNNDSVIVEFQAWWKNASDFGYWKPFFILFEWFKKLQQERVPQNVWYENVFRTFLELSWPIHPQERQVNQRIKSNLYDGVNSLSRDWIQYWSSFQREHQSVALISWKKWITTAVELNLRDWFLKFQESERLGETDEPIEMIPHTVISSFVSTLWLTGMLPVRFLPWVMFVLPLEAETEEIAWKWRSFVWDSIDTIIRERQIKTTVEYTDCWRRWKNGFTDNALKVLKPNIQDWNLRLRYKWSTLCPSWNIEITQEDIEKKRKVVETPVENEPEVKETPQTEVENVWDSSVLTDQDYSNIRSLTEEWKEMGKQGWMDSYFPEWYMDEGNYERKMVWWDGFFYTASQIFDMKNIWDNPDWCSWIQWILECSTDHKKWLNSMLNKMKDNPPDWTIECPFYENISQKMSVY